MLVQRFESSGRRFTNFHQYYYYYCYYYLRWKGHKTGRPYPKHFSNFLNDDRVVRVVDGGVAEVAGHESSGSVGHVPGQLEGRQVQLLQLVLPADRTHLVPVTEVLKAHQQC